MVIFVGGTMNIYNVIGYIILLLPFIAMFVAIAKMHGLKVASTIFAIGIAAVLIISLGEYLVNLD